MLMGYNIIVFIFVLIRRNRYELFSLGENLTTRLIQSNRMIIKNHFDPLATRHVYGLSYIQSCVTGFSPRLHKTNFIYKNKKYQIYNF